LRGVHRDSYQAIGAYPRRPGFTYLYVLTEDDGNPSPVNVRYVGKTTQKPLSRLYHHLQDRHRREVYRDRWIHKLVESGREPRMHVVALVPDEYASKAEIRLIASFRKAGARLTNLSDGGEGALGHKVSEETRRKISQAHKGIKENVPMSAEKRQLLAQIRSRRWANPENRKRQSEKMKERLARVPFTEERKRRISEALKGKSPSPQTRERLRRLRVGTKHSSETRSKISESHQRMLLDRAYRKRLSACAKRRKYGFDPRQVILPYGGSL
jgi:hypothetical protein